MGWFRRSALLAAAFLIPACGDAGRETSVVTVQTAEYPKGWGVTELIERDNGGHALSPRVAFAPDGTAVAAWSSGQGTPPSVRSDLWAARYVPGVGWGPARLLETLDTGSAFLPRIVADAAGNFIVAWTQTDGIRYSIWAARYTAGVGWGPAVLLETSDENASGPEIAMDPAGNAMAVWFQLTPANLGMWAARYVAGVGWEAPVLLKANSHNYAGYSFVGLDAAGNATAVYSLWDGTRFNLWASRFEPAAGWDAPQEIESTDLLVNMDAPIAVAPDGTVFVLWEYPYTYAATLQATRYVPGSGWQPAEPIQSGNKPGRYSSIAVDASGNATAVWIEEDAAVNRYDVWASRWVAGAGWEDARRIEAYNAGSPTGPRAAADAAGNALVTWAAYDGTTTHAWANRYVVGLGWDTPRKIKEAQFPGGADAPWVAMDPEGNGMAVWPEFDALRRNIWACRYE